MRRQIFPYGIVILFTILNSTVVSQNFEWANLVAKGATGLSISVDASGNVYTTGRFNNSATDFDPGPGVYNLATQGGQDIFVSKYDANGNFVWAKSMGAGYTDVGYSIKVDLSGNVYVTGVFQATVDFDPGPGVYNLTTDGTTDVFVCKLNTNGDLVWTKSMGGSGMDYSYDLELDASGNVYTTGSYIGTADFDPGVAVFNLNSSGSSDVFISKLDPNGNFIWAKSMGGSAADEASSMAIDDAGNLLITGAFTTSGDFDPGSNNVPLYSSGNTDVFVCKLSLAGSFVWAESMGGTGVDKGYSIGVDSSGNVYTYGTFEGTADFYPGTGTVNLISNGSSESFISKLNPGGNFVWAKSIGGTGPDYGNSIFVDASGNIYGTGIFQNSGDFDSGPGSLILSSNGSYDFFMFRMDTGGNLIWAKSIGSTGLDQGQSIVVDSYEKIYVTGSANGTVDFDPGSGVYNLTFVGSSGNPGTFGFVLKLYQCSSDITAPAPDMSALPTITSVCSVTSLTPPTATDNCAGSVSGSPNVTLPINSSATIIWTYADASGNTSTQTQDVVITDSVAPVANTGTLPNVTDQCSVSSLTAPTATDDCMGTVTGTHNAALPITSSTTITWTYDDGHGNTSTQTQSVIINDVTAPVANLANLPAVTDPCSVSVLTAPTATDNCVGTVTGTHNATLPINASTTVTWTYDDGHGNTSAQTQSVVISGLSSTVSQLSSNVLEADGSGYSYQWIDCNNGNSTIPGATLQSFTASVSGSYAVIVTNGTCSDTSGCTALNFVGLEKNPDSKFQMYPNPASGKVTISSTIQFNKIEVLNSLGQLVGEYAFSETQDVVISLPGEDGLYFIRIYSNESSVVRPVLKKN